MEASTQHRHRWIGVEFYLDDGHPLLRQTCECGATRSLKAWERYWQPDEAAPGADVDGTGRGLGTQ